MMSRPIAVGIDLGTTNSGVAALKNEEPEILKLGADPFIPSCVAFNGNKVLVGKKALNHEDKNNVISGIKYIIGLDYEAAKNMAERQELLFNITEKDGRPQIEVDYNDGRKSFSPEEISAMILSELKTIAKKRLDCRNISAVITVPTHFTSKRRAATKLAAEIAGIDVLQVVNESTAAAIAYETLRPDRLGRRRRTLVFDLGGGTLDITIIKTRGKSITVRANGGNLELGGEDFSKGLIYYTENRVRAMGALDDFTKREIIKNANRVKEALSFRFSESFNFEVYGRLIMVDRAKLDHVNKDKYEAAIRLVDDVMTRAGITRDKIHHVVLSGGSVKIPFFREKLGKLFGRKKIQCNRTECDQFVVKGAAILASFLSGANNTNRNDYIMAIRGLNFSDVTPFSLGFRDSNGSTIFVISKNRNIPVLETRTWNVDQLGPERISFQICEGENINFDENELMYSIDILLAITRNGKVSLAVTFELRNSSWLRVTVKQQHCPNDPVKFEINFDQRLSDKERVECQKRRVENIMQQPQSESAYAQAMDVEEPQDEQPEIADSFEDDDEEEDTKTCKALYNYEARTEQEISMRRGDRFTVTQLDEGNGWTQVSRDNMVGFVPTNRLEFERTEETKTASTFD